MLLSCHGLLLLRGFLLTGFHPFIITLNNSRDSSIRIEKMENPILEATQLRIRKDYPRDESATTSVTRIQVSGAYETREHQHLAYTDAIPSTLR